MPERQRMTTRLRALFQPGFTGWPSHFRTSDENFLSATIAYLVRTGESIAGHWVKVGIRVFPSVSNSFTGISSIHLANPG